MRKCCNKRMSFVEYVLRSEIKGFQFDVVGVYTCKNKMCLCRVGWAYRVRTNGTMDIVGDLNKEQMKKWFIRTHTQIVSRNDHKVTRGGMVVSDGTFMMARDVASIYKKVLRDVRLRTNQI